MTLPRHKMAWVLRKKACEQVCYRKVSCLDHDGGAHCCGLVSEGERDCQANGGVDDGDVQGSEDDGEGAVSGAGAGGARGKVVGEW